MYPVSELRTRYNLSKQAEINRRKHLGIVPVKIDKQFCVTKQQLDLLDQFDEFLKSRPGVKMSEFQLPTSTPTNSSVQPTETTLFSDGKVELVLRTL